MYQGHLPDGSSVQRHSAGALYPYVIICRGGGELSWGFIGPDTDGEVWCCSSEAAYSVAGEFKRRRDARSAAARPAPQSAAASAAIAAINRAVAHNQREWSRFAAQRR